MKNTFLKTIGTAALAILMMAMFAQISVSAQDIINEQPQENSVQTAPTLEGSWNVLVTQRNCTTSVPIGTNPAMVTFMQGGTMMEAASRIAPSLKASGHGVWSRVSEFHPQYTSAFQFFRFNADGTYAGRQIVRQQIELNADGNSFTSSATAQILDVNGNVIQNNCSNGVGTRFE